MKKTTVALLLFPALDLLISGFVTPPSKMGAKPPSYWPTTEWRTCTPEQQGMSAGKLSDLFSNTQKKKMLIDGIVITRNGYIVAERYDNGFSQSSSHPVYSVTKSLTSAVLGIAIQDGKIKSVNDRVLNYFPHQKFANMSDVKKRMTIKQFITMSSGLNWPEESKDLHTNQTFFDEFMNSPDLTRFVLDRPLDRKQVGVWNYSTGEPQVISSIIQGKVGEKESEYAEEKLFGPIGMNSVDWPRTSTGVSYGGTAVSMIPRDMAKFGYLYLNNGEWNGKQIISKKWVQESTAPQVKTNFPDVNYGYYWWVQNLSGHKEYEALGYRGQNIAVIPDLKIVVSFTSQGVNIDDLLQNYIIPAVVSSDPIRPDAKADARLMNLEHNR